MRVLLLHCASCTHCNSRVGGLRTYNSIKLFESHLLFKRPPGKTVYWQTQKAENDGRRSFAIDDNHFALYSNQNDEVSKSETENTDPPFNGLHKDNERHDEACTSDQKCDAECHVEVISWRERRITARIMVDASPQRVWDVLTDYERLSEFIPNLVCSEKIPCPYPGRIWLLQRGLQRMMYWNIEAHVVLELREFQELETGSELHFFMVDGDFKRFDGKWYLRSSPRTQTTWLHYEVSVVPTICFPAAFIENIIKADLPKNLCAIAKRAEAESVSDIKISEIANKHISPKPVPANCMEEGCAVINTSAMDLHWNGFGRACKLGSQLLADEIHFRRLDDLLENGGVHRQVAASITVKASSKEVWNVLTAYEALPEFVPNLANSKVLSREGNRVRLLQEGCKCLLYMVLHAQVTLDLYEQPEQEISFEQVEGDFYIFQGKWTLSPLGSQHTVLKYAVDTTFWKDYILAESLVEEVIYEDLPTNLCAIRDRVESLANCPSAPPVTQEETTTEESPRDATTVLGNGGAPIRGLIDEDCPSAPPITQEENATKESSRDASTAFGNGRAPVRELMNDFCLLEKELKDFIATHGVDGVMPMRRHIRQHKRHDLEKALTAMGGFRVVAVRMKLSLSYKPRKPSGYWDNVWNLRSEVLAAQKELGCDPSVLPSRLSLERLGRFDLARAFEKWGGAWETAKILGLRAKAQEAKERNKKRTSAVEVDGGLREIAANNEPLLIVDSAGASADAGKEGGQPVAKDGGVKPDVGDDMEVHAGRPTAGFHEKASQRKQDADVNQEASQQADPLGHRDAAPKPANDSAPSSSPAKETSKAKEKKMPYKMGVPEESSKWLTVRKSR